jgi:GT2 family glycosyltransferase
VAQVGIVSVVWKEKRQDLERFGDALAAAWARLPPERRGGSVLVENGTASPVAAAARAALVSALGEQPETVRLAENRGPARAYNIGLAQLNADYMTLFDPDGAPDPETLQQLVGALDAHPSAAVAAAEVLPFDGSPPSGGPPLDVEWASAGATVYRTDALREVGGFDELFAFTCEEMDLGYRLRKAGWTVLRIPAAAFRHEVAHKSSWRRELRYIEFLMTWRHIHFNRRITAKAWLRQFAYAFSMGRRHGWRVGGGAVLGMFAYFRHIPASERRR